MNNLEGEMHIGEKLNPGSRREFHILTLLASLCITHPFLYHIHQTFLRPCPLRFDNVPHQKGNELGVKRSGRKLNSSIQMRGAHFWPERLFV